MTGGRRWRRPIASRQGKGLMESIRALIAGGGTGGHLFPGIAVARELEGRGEDVRILFVGGRNRMDSEILSDYGYQLSFIDVEGLKGRGWKSGSTVLIKLPKSIFQSLSILRWFAPHFVLGMGGYSAGPMCLAARLMGIPTAIHEQNSYPGLTNRWLSRVVDRAFISFPETSGYLKGRSVSRTGNPVRKELFSRERENRKADEAFTVLVLGGSQGAKAVNIAFVGALEYLAGKGRYPRVVHQTGKTDFRRVSEDYSRRGLDAEVVPFIRDIAGAYRRADLVVSRAGATTLFELAATGSPSILVPYPHAANRHQETNARSLVNLGGAEMVLESELTEAKLAGLLGKYMDNSAALARMGENARELGRPDAAGLMVDQLLEMSGSGGDPDRSEEA